MASLRILRLQINKFSFSAKSFLQLLRDGVLDETNFDQTELLRKILFDTSLAMLRACSLLII